MVREILTINVGQCGVQLGQCVWEQYCAEHSVNNIGTKSKSKNNSHSQKCAMDVFFEETDIGQYVPRNIMVDLEPNVIDDVKISSLAAIFNPDFLLSGNEDAANNFARGYYTVGAEMMSSVIQKIRQLVQHCDNLQGIVVNHSVGGGTGSGLGSLLLEYLNDHYSRCTTVFF